MMIRYNIYAKRLRIIRIYCGEIKTVIKQHTDVHKACTIPVLKYKCIKWDFHESQRSKKNTHRYLTTH